VYPYCTVCSDPAKRTPASGGNSARFTKTDPEIPLSASRRGMCEQCHQRPKFTESNSRGQIIIYPFCGRPCANLAKQNIAGVTAQSSSKDTYQYSSGGNQEIKSDSNLPQDPSAQSGAATRITPPSEGKSARFTKTDPEIPLSASRRGSNVTNDPNSRKSTVAGKPSFTRTADGRAATWLNRRSLVSRHNHLPRIHTPTAICLRIRKLITRRCRLSSRRRRAGCVRLRTLRNSPSLMEAYRGL